MAFVNQRNTAIYFVFCIFFVSIFTGMAQYHLLCFLRKNLFAFFNNLADIILYFPTFYILVSVIKDDKILKRYIRI